MTIKCPYCGSEDFYKIDSYGGKGEDIQEMFACDDCGKPFSVIYEAVDVVKEEEENDY
jgi:DNA-directed RNA polymerase subunit RPC12/RpoP